MSHSCVGYISAQQLQMCSLPIEQYLLQLRARGMALRPLYGHMETKAAVTADGSLSIRRAQGWSHDNLGELCYDLKLACSTSPGRKHSSRAHETLRGSRVSRGIEERGNFWLKKKIPFLPTKLEKGKKGREEYYSVLFPAATVNRPTNRKSYWLYFPVTSEDWS